AGRRDARDIESSQLDEGPILAPRNVPEQIRPLACTGRKPGCAPASVLIAATVWRMRVSGVVAEGMPPFPFRFGCRLRVRRKRASARPQYCCPNRKLSGVTRHVRAASKVYSAEIERPWSRRAGIVESVVAADGIDDNSKRHWAAGDDAQARGCRPAGAGSSQPRNSRRNMEGIT